MHLVPTTIRSRFAKIVQSPIDVGAVDGAGDYFGLIDTLLDRLLAAAR